MRVEAPNSDSFSCDGSILTALRDNFISGGSKFIAADNPANSGTTLKLENSYGQNQATSSYAYARHTYMVSENNAADGGGSRNCSAHSYHAYDLNMEYGFVSNCDGAEEYCGTMWYLRGAVATINGGTSVNSMPERGLGSSAWGVRRRQGGEHAAVSGPSARFA